jgi:hypothetical protein
MPLKIQFNKFYLIICHLSIAGSYISIVLSTNPHLLIPANLKMYLSLKVHTVGFTTGSFN